MGKENHNKSDNAKAYWGCRHGHETVAAFSIVAQTAKVCCVADR